MFCDILVIPAAIFLVGAACLECTFAVPIAANHVVNVAAIFSLWNGINPINICVLHAAAFLDFVRCTYTYMLPFLSCLVPLV